MSEYVTNVSAKKWLSVGKLGKFHYICLSNKLKMNTIWTD